jgi:hypothetical protein
MPFGELEDRSAASVVLMAHSSWADGKVDLDVLHHAGVLMVQNMAMEYELADVTFITRADDEAIIAFGIRL